MTTTTTKALVVGSGCMGLRTALELLNKRIPIILRSAHPPLHPTTCSQGAGGLWMPFHINHDRANIWAKQTLQELLSKLDEKNKEKLSNGENENAENNHNNDNDDDDDDIKEPIEIMPNVQFHKVNHLHPDSKFTFPEWTKEKELKFQAMSLDMLFWQNNIHKLRLPDRKALEQAGYLYNWLFFSPVVDPPKMLQKMYKEVISHPLAVDVNVNMGKKYTSMDEIIQEAISNGCDTIINCTGLGSKSLCNDNDLMGARGILYHYDRNNCPRWTDTNLINDAVLGADDPPWGADQPCYMIPRGDLIVIGGSFLVGDTENEIRFNERIRLEQNASILGIDTSKVRPIGEWTGFRPYRSGVRLEVDDVLGVNEGVKVVHNYGHGGSGWTVFVGAAKEVVRLLKLED